ncbi:MAG: DUF1800 family protein [Flavobacteriales bacterium]|nr:DUF1800 family protein [Flavobacteriales bacterium]MBP9080007.1 DUF1800 family protein [Flavobacteriales bacterium]
MPVQHYTGPFGKPELRHLLRRTLFGASPLDMAHFDAMALDDVVSELLSFSNTTTPPVKAYSGEGPGGVYDPALIDPVVPFGEPWINYVRLLGSPPNPIPKRNESLQYWWVGQLVQQERNLREKLTLFWANHLPIQFSIVFMPESSYWYCQLLRDGCKGNVRDLMVQLAKDGAMLIYLNGIYNMASAPDENFGREVMELFTLGVDSGYTQDDVAAAARVFTGWSVTEWSGSTRILPTVVFTPANHDQNDKQFSPFFNDTVIQGQSGANGGSLEIEAFMDMIFANETSSRFIVRELYRWFVRTDIAPEVEDDLIEPLAQLFRDHVGSPDQMEVVLKALLTSEHFFSTEVRGCMVKNPVDMTVGLIRSSLMPMPTADHFEAQYNVWSKVQIMMADASQAIGEPPNVAGWPAYYQAPLYDLLWMDSATTANRSIIFNRLGMTGMVTPMQLVTPADRGLMFVINYVDLVSHFDQPSDPNSLVQEVADMFYGVAVSPTVLGQLKTQYLLQGQVSDYYWTSAYNTYVADPSTTDPTASQVPGMLQSLFLKMFEAAEFQLH